MGAVLPDRLLVGAEPEPRFVDECSGLERLAGGLMDHFAGGHFAELGIDEWQQLVGRLRVTLLNAVQNEGDFLHTGRLSVRPGD